MSSFVPWHLAAHSVAWHARPQVWLRCLTPPDMTSCLIETVGAGQGEVDIARLAHTTLVVEAPGLGDDIQAIKAGILEIADLLVINKADRPGVENTEKALRSMLELAHSRPTSSDHHGQQMEVASGAAAEADWPIPILRTIATEGTGIPELADQIRAHAEFLHKSGLWEGREAARLASELNAILQETLRDRFSASLPEGRYNEVMQQVTRKQLSPEEAVILLIEQSRPMHETDEEGHTQS